MNDMEEIKSNDKLSDKSDPKKEGIDDKSPNEQTHEKMIDSIQKEALKKKIKRFSDLYAGLYH